MRLEDEETKRLRIRALKEKRRLEKTAKILKEREYQRALEAKCKADEFYTCWLLRRIGVERFKQLIERKRDNSRKCEQFRKKVFKRTYFLNWRDHYLKLRNEKLTLAEEVYEKFSKRKTLRAWQFYVQEEHSKFNVAVDWCDLKRAEIVFKYWVQYNTCMRANEASKINQANSHHEWHLKWKVLDCWQRLPQILRLEIETEERRQRWRMKIWELLPDYTPNTVDLS
ncbi:PREDICTED: coiled-coil domain-containing protein 191-like [Rhagoletis zephyria]|uniref:coiled-coil domain-containing protein 191-like n=1 Tax=Rhagoletis zephyria TaxID=28612 RepID=UPI00081133BC|nr:PREDICTED: coiled-coil domain-containing protein 191-like [Rhagoletis zephyria]XP_036341254.1 coiled-coil domain-containing protein 191-like [Rhagoletis pomonella]